MHWPSSCQNGHGSSRSTRKYRKNVRDVMFCRIGEKNFVTLLSTLLKSQLQSDMRPSRRTDRHRRHCINSVKGLEKNLLSKVLGRTSNMRMRNNMVPNDLYCGIVYHSISFVSFRISCGQQEEAAEQHLSISDYRNR